MSRRQKVKSIILGSLTVISVLFMVLIPELGHPIMIWSLSVSFLYFAVKQLLYYFAMARFMIGGNKILFKAFIELDLAWFIFSLHHLPNFYVTIYLVAGLIFSAVIDILRALEERRLKSPSWKLKFAQGIFSIILSIICVIFISSIQVTVYIFCLGLLQSACIRIMKAWQKTEMVYIQ